MNAPEIRAWLRQWPWDPPAVPESVASVPTMIGPEERTLLYRLAAEWYDGSGAIIDAGCFLGGSTAAFVDGLRASPRDLPAKPVHTYDLFVLGRREKRGYAHLVEDIPVAGSMLPRFQQLMGDRLDRVHVHAGDIREEAWPGEPVSILFFDIAKTWSVNDHVNREFFPSLVPYESVLIQQDFVHEWLPWIHIGMELLEDAFELIGWAPYGSAIFVPTRQITRDEIPSSLRDAVPDDEKLRLLDRAAARFDGAQRGVIELGRAVLLEELGDAAAGFRDVEKTLAAYGGYDRVANSAASVRDYLSYPGMSPFLAPRPGTS